MLTRSTNPVPDLDMLTRILEEEAQRHPVPKTTNTASKRIRKHKKKTEQVNPNIQLDNQSPSTDNNPLRTQHRQNPMLTPTQHHFLTTSYNQKNDQRGPPDVTLTIHQSDQAARTTDQHHTETDEEELIIDLSETDETTNKDIRPQKSAKTNKRSHKTTR